MRLKKQSLPLYLLLSLLMFSSCSRQLGNLASSHLRAESGLPSHTYAISTCQSDSTQQCSSIGSVLASQTSANTILADRATSHRHHRANKLAKKLQEAIISDKVVQALTGKMNINKGPIAKTAEINKAGFILIGAGLIAILVKLYIPGFIVVFLGLILLISPWFRKRY